MRSALSNPWLWLVAYFTNVFVCIALRVFAPSVLLSWAPYSHSLLLAGFGFMLARNPKSTMGTAAVWGAALAFAEFYLVVWLVGSRFIARLTAALHSAAMSQVTIGLAALVAALLGAFAVVIPYIVIRAERRRGGHAT